MARQIASVHVDIARLMWEVSKYSTDSAESMEKLGRWTKQLAECLVLRKPELHEYGAHLLLEVEEFRKAEIERKKANKSALSAESIPHPRFPHTDRSDQTDQRKKNPKKDSPPAPRERDSVWDSVVASFNFKEPHPPTEATRIGKVVRDLKIKGATAAEIARRHANAIKSWNGKPFGPEALVKNWDALDVVAGLQNGTFNGPRKAEYIP